MVEHIDPRIDEIHQDKSEAPFYAKRNGACKK